MDMSFALGFAPTRPVLTGTAPPPVAAPANTAAPVVTGTPQSGQTLSATTGNWSGSPSGFAYQWRRGGVAVAGATGASLVLGDSDVGAAMTCQVTASNAGGSASATSAATAPVAAVAPANTAAPAITGTLAVGQTLTVSNGSWSGSPSFARQWQADGVDIAGATGASYLLQPADPGRAVGCRVTATNAGGSASALAAAVALVAPGGLPTLSSAAYAAFGAQRVAAGYGGALYQLRRASDGATIDVSPQAGGDYAGRAAIAAWAGGSALSVPAIYDQSGNARHLTQATVANQPLLDTAILTQGVPAFVFDPSSSGRFVGVGGLSLDMAANSAFIAFAPTQTWNGKAILSYTSEDTTSSIYQEWYHGSEQMILANNGSYPASSTTAPNIRPNVVGFTNSAGGMRHYANGASNDVYYSRSSTTMQRIRLGRSGFGTGLDAEGRVLGLVLYAAALSPTDANTVVASMRTAFAIPSTYDYTVVFDGDSITQGFGATLARNMPSQIAFTRSARAFNTGVYGELLAAHYSNRAARFGGIYASGMPNVFFVQAGTNDLQSGTTGANLYANSATPLVAYLKGIGFKVVHCTILPRTGSSGWTTPTENERLAYNSLVVANSAAADLVLDLASDSVMGASSAPNDTALYVDKLHPANAGYARLATLYQAALGSALGATP